MSRALPRTPEGAQALAALTITVEYDGDPDDAQTTTVWRLPGVGVQLVTPTSGTEITLCDGAPGEHLLAVDFGARGSSHRAAEILHAWCGGQIAPVGRAWTAATTATDDPDVASFRAC